MKNLDVFSRRVAVITLGISIVLLSGSLFILSLRSIPSASANNISAHERLMDMDANKLMAHKMIPIQDDVQEEDIRAIQAFGIGIREGVLYFGILYNNNTIGLHKSMADGEDVLDW
jgi:hypothetical protein